MPGARVSAADTLAITTAGNITPTAETYLVAVFRPSSVGNTALYT